MGVDQENIDFFLSFYFFFFNLGELSLPEQSDSISFSAVMRCSCARGDMELC